MFTDSLLPGERSSFRVSELIHVKWSSQTTYSHKIPSTTAYNDYPALKILLIHPMDLFAMSDFDSETEVSEVKITEASNYNSSFSKRLKTPLLGTARAFETKDLYCKCNTGCKTARCKCNKNGAACSATCPCTNCINPLAELATFFGEKRR